MHASLGSDLWVYMTLVAHTTIWWLETVIPQAESLEVVYLTKLGNFWQRGSAGTVHVSSVIML